MFEQFKEKFQAVQQDFSDGYSVFSFFFFSSFSFFIKQLNTFYTFHAFIHQTMYNANCSWVRDNPSSITYKNLCEIVNLLYITSPKIQLSRIFWYIETIVYLIRDKIQGLQNFYT